MFSSTTNFLPPTLFANLQNSYCETNHKESDKTYEFLPSNMDKSTFQYIFFPNSAGAFSINESYAHNKAVRFSEQTYVRLDKEIVPFSLYDELLSVYYDKHSCQTKDITPQKLIEFDKECKQYRSLFHIKGSTHSISLDNIIHNIVDSKWVITTGPDLKKASAIQERVKLVLHYKSFVLDVAITMHFNYDLVLNGFTYKPDADAEMTYNWNSDNESEINEETNVVVPKNVYYTRPKITSTKTINIEKFVSHSEKVPEVFMKTGRSTGSENELKLEPSEYRMELGLGSKPLYTREEDEVNREGSECVNDEQKGQAAIRTLAIRKD
jgi:hypothetical protein